MIELINPVSGVRFTVAAKDLTGGLRPGPRNGPQNGPTFVFVRGFPMAFEVVQQPPTKALA